MKKAIGTIIVTAITISLCFAMLITNPTKEQFADWVKIKYVENIDKENPSLADVVMTFAGSSVVKTIINEKNFVIFSIYELDTDSEPNNFKAIGILNNFIPISGDFNL